MGTHQKAGTDESILTHAMTEFERRKQRKSKIAWENCLGIGQFATQFRTHCIYPKKHSV